MLDELLRDGCAAVPGRHHEARGTILHKAGIGAGTLVQQHPGGSFFAASHGVADDRTASIPDDRRQQETHTDTHIQGERAGVSLMSLSLPLQITERATYVRAEP